jgi:hypothetical protein
LIHALLQPLNEDALNGDEKMRLAAAAADGVSNFSFSPAQLAEWTKAPAEERARQLVQRYVPGIAGTALERQVITYLERSARHDQSDAVTRAALATLLESPSYQLC